MRAYWKWGLVLFVLLWLAAGWNYYGKVKLDRYPHFEITDEIRLGKKTGLAIATGHPRFKPFNGQYTTLWPEWLHIPEGSYSLHPKSGQQIASLEVTERNYPLAFESGKRWKTQATFLLFMSEAEAVTYLRDLPLAGGEKWDTIERGSDERYSLHMLRSEPEFHLWIRLTPIDWPGKECTHATVVLFTGNTPADVK